MHKFQIKCFKIPREKKHKYCTQKCAKNCSNCDGKLFIFYMIYIKTSNVRYVQGVNFVLQNFVAAANLVLLRLFCASFALASAKFTLTAKCGVPRKFEHFSA